MSDSLSTLIEISLKTAAEALLASSSLQPAKLKTRSSTTDLRWRVRFETNIDNRSCLALFSDPSTFPFIQPGTKLAGIDRFSVLHGSVASLDFARISVPCSAARLLAREAAKWRDPPTH